MEQFHHLTHSGSPRSTFFWVKIFFSIMSFIVSEDLLILWGTLIVSLDSFFWSKGNFSKFPWGQINPGGHNPDYSTFQEERKLGISGGWSISLYLILLFSGQALPCCAWYFESRASLFASWRWTSNGEAGAWLPTLVKEAWPLQPEITLFPRFFS